MSDYEDMTIEERNKDIQTQISSLNRLWHANVNLALRKQINAKIEKLNEERRKLDKH